MSLFQAQVTRIQKERDSALAEAASCRERVEAAAAAANRAARERDSAATELDVLRERWEKAHQQHQKLTVRSGLKLAPSSLMCVSLIL